MAAGGVGAWAEGEGVSGGVPTDTAAADGKTRTFRVRLLGRVFPPVFALAGSTPETLPGDDERPYGEATVEGRLTESLAEVLDRAAVLLGLTYLHGSSAAEGVAWIRFRESDDDRFAYDSRLQWARQLTVLDADGRLRLGRRLDQVTVADLLRTAERGLIDGDPLQPYLVPTVPAGGVEPWSLDWSSLIGNLQLFWTALGAVTTVDGTVSIARGLRERLRRAPEVLAERQLMEGGTPELLWDVFQHRPVLPDDAAEWLRCSREDAEALLLALGLDDRGDGLWAPSASDDASVMRDVLLELRERWDSGGDNPKTLMTRLLHLVETGERLPRADTSSWQAHLDRPSEEFEVEDVEELDDEGDPDAERFALPLQHLRLDCACDDQTCRLTARFRYVGGAQLRLEFEAPAEHFEVPSGFLELLIGDQLGSET